MTRIFKYSLRPTALQAELLKGNEQSGRKAWNMLIKEYKKAKHLIETGKAGVVISLLTEILKHKNLTGVRAKQVNERMASGLSKAKSLQEVIDRQIEKITEIPVRKKDGRRCIRVYTRKLAGKVASEIVNSRRDWLVKDGSNAIIQSIIQKWDDVINDFTKEEPRFKKISDSVAVQKQICNNKFNVENDTVNLSTFGSVCLSNVEINLHRPLPEDVVVKQLALTRSGDIWYISIFVDGNKKCFERKFNNVTETIGVDPGLKAALTTSDGKVYSPPIKAVSKRQERRLARLQRKADRQRRVNNPHCFNKDGNWIRGKRIRTYTKGMIETASKITEIGEYRKNSRSSFYHLVSIELLNSANQINVGKWRGMLAKDRGTRKKSYQHAISSFVATLKDKANLSTTTKAVVEVDEHFTTVTCSKCKEKTGPTGIENLGVRQWTCKSCGTTHNRDINAAKNIASAAVSQTVQPVTPIKKNRNVRSVTKVIKTRATETISPQDDGLKLETCASGQVMTQLPMSSRSSEVVVTVQDVKNQDTAERVNTIQKMEHLHGQTSPTDTQELRDRQ